MTPEEIAKKLVEDHVTGGVLHEWVTHIPICTLDKRKAVADITDAIREAVQEEWKRLRTILGFDVTKVDGEGHNISYDPLENLDGALIDLRRQNADKVCLSTLSKLEARLIAFDKATLP